MSDELDRVNEREAQLLALSLAPHLNKPALSEAEIKQIALSGRDCIECGLPIPPQRLQAAPFAVRCICCQQEYESNK